MPHRARDAQAAFISRDIFQDINIFIRPDNRNLEQFSDIDMIRYEYTYKEKFDFEAGGSVNGLRLVYHASGLRLAVEEDCAEGREGHAEGRKVIWICHALTANSDAEEWWPELVGPGKFFDTEKIYCGMCQYARFGIRLVRTFFSHAFQSIPIRSQCRFGKAILF